MSVLLRQCSHELHLQFRRRNPWQPWSSRHSDSL